MLIKPKQLKTVLILIFTMLILNPAANAGPAVKLCLQENCKKPESINITDKTWLIVKDIFSTPYPIDIDEQDNICSSILLIQNDIYNTLKKNNTEKHSVNDIFSSNDINNHYKNTRYILSLLLDEYLVTRHYLRKTVKVNSWGRKKSQGLNLQSIKDAKLYTLTIDRKNINISPVISSYINFKQNKHNKPVDVNSNMDEEDFE